MYLFGWKKFIQEYDFEPKDFQSDNSEYDEPSFEDLLISKTESAHINHRNVEFAKDKADDYLYDMDNELAKLAESKLTISNVTCEKREQEIVDAYLEKLKSIKVITLISNNELTKQDVTRKIGESRSTFKKREQEIADASLAKFDADGCLHEMDDELTKLIESKLSSDSRATFEKRSKEIVNAELAKLEYLNSIKSTAEVYLSAIDVELAKKDEPELIVDPTATTDLKHPYINISSLDQWAQKHYSIYIFAPPKHLTLIPTVASSESNGGAMKHLQTTFAFALEALAEKYVPKFGDSKDNINIKAIASHLQELAAVANKDNLYGQSSEAIRKRIAEAMKIKKDKLAGK